MSILLCSTVKRGKAIKYIDTLVNSRSITVGEMCLLEEKVKRKMRGWIESVMSIWGKSCENRYMYIKYDCLSDQWAFYIRPTFIKWRTHKYFLWVLLREDIN
jgi:hypothetical protein